jgi:hypothetical protein
MALSLLRKLMPATAVNALLALLFVFSNYATWDYAQSTTHILQLVSFSPFSITAIPLGGLTNNNQIIPIDELKSPVFNFPFWLFFAAMAINLVLILDSTKNSNSGAPRN